MFQIASQRSTGRKNRMPPNIFHDDAIDLFEFVFGLTEFYIQIRIRINNHGTFLFQRNYHFNICAVFTTHLEKKFRLLINPS